MNLLAREHFTLIQFFFSLTYTTVLHMNRVLSCRLNVVNRRIKQSSPVLLPLLR